MSPASTPLGARAHEFPLGSFRCYAVSDGSHDYAPAAFFESVEPGQVRAELDRFGVEGDLITTPYTFLLVETEAAIVLVDLGAGSLFPSTGHLRASIEGAGFSPSDVDHVLISHGHPDHVGGALAPDGTLQYARATYFVRRGEWDFWFSPRATERTDRLFVEIARTNLGAMESRVTLVDGETEILPGVAMLEAPGHTPGHSVISFESNGERLLFAADTVIHPLHLEHPDWLPVYDILPAEAEASKRRIFDLAAAEGCLVLAQHFPPFPSVGRIERWGRGWRYHPTNI